MKRQPPDREPADGEITWVELALITALFAIAFAQAVHAPWSAHHG